MYGVKAAGSNEFWAEKRTSREAQYGRMALKSEWL
jgi:hypothetical protein